MIGNRKGEEMKLAELLKKEIEIYNELFKDEKIKEYERARKKLLDYSHKDHIEKELYKSVNGVDYFIELPREEIRFTNEGVIIRQYSYNGFYQSEKSKTNYCLGLCNMTKEQIVANLERDIKENNEDIIS